MAAKTAARSEFHFLEEQIYGYGCSVIENVRKESIAVTLRPLWEALPQVVVGDRLYVIRKCGLLSGGRSPLRVQVDNIICTILSV